jgi:uncharacterized protein (TIGR03083 family)
MAADLWPLVRAERERFADLLESLAPEQWQQQTLCAGWTVHDMAAHCVATAHTTPGSFFAGLVGTGFRFHRLSEKNIKKYGAGSPAEMVAAIRESAGRTTGPPGPPQTPLSEIVMHSGDVATPLGLTHQNAPEALTATLDFYKRAQLLIGSKKRAEGLHLVATDVGWENGTGPTVSGPAISLLQALSGRRAGLTALTGDGVTTLSARMP